MHCFFPFTIVSSNCLTFGIHIISTLYSRITQRISLIYLLMAVLSTMFISSRISLPTLHHAGCHDPLDRAPFDGPGDEGQWYCPDCKDGPYPSWQNSCQKCHTNFHLDAIIGPFAKLGGGSAPADGEPEIVWFCSACGDGPYSDWNPACACCGHARCGRCNEENVSNK